MIETKLKINGLISCYSSKDINFLAKTAGAYFLFGTDEENLFHITHLKYETDGDENLCYLYKYVGSTFSLVVYNSGERISDEQIDVSEDPISGELAVNIMGELNLGHLRDLSYISILIRLLVSNLSRISNKLSKPDSGLSIVHLEVIHNYIREHLHHHISLNELADAVHMNANRFSKLFRASLGNSPYSYVNGVKMQRARALLAEGELSIIQIGIQVGFDNPSHFSRVFKKYYGLSPRSYMKEVLLK